MLKELYIKNYALIQKIELNFEQGLTIITGETGAGKSILLGGLELVRGKRAQQGLLKNTKEKSVVEARFQIEDYNLAGLFNQLDLDYDAQTIIRRELLPNGKSRAFVNDTPVRLENLVGLTEKLIDVHAQHQVFELNNKDYQFNLIDAIANNDKLLANYKKNFLEHKLLTEIQKDFQNKLQTAEKELEYKSFQLDELEKFKLEDIDFEQIEQQLKMMENTEEIQTVLGETHHLLDDETLGVIANITQIKNALAKITNFSASYQEVYTRFESVQIELQDLLMEIENLSEETTFNPTEKEHLDNVFSQVNRLLIKHQAVNVDELISLKKKLTSEVTDLSTIKDRIASLQEKIGKKEDILNDIASKIHQNRTNAIPKLITRIEAILKRLSMRNTKLKIELLPQNNYLKNGKDDLLFQISSDAGKSFGELKRIASGGELSRIMLAVKTVLSKYKKLPTIIFDEIDSGVSGEVAQNMSEILKELSQNMQVIVITHLPQIAVAGAHHFKVYKTTSGDITTQVKKLSKTERIYEIAEMIEGKPPSDSALRHAEHLLG